MRWQGKAVAVAVAQVAAQLQLAAGSAPHQLISSSHLQAPALGVEAALSHGDLPHPSKNPLATHVQPQEVLQTVKHRCEHASRNPSVSGLMANAHFKHQDQTCLQTVLWPYSPAHIYV